MSPGPAAAVCTKPLTDRNGREPMPQPECSLQLSLEAEAPWLELGRVRCGASCKRHLTLCNDTTHEQVVELDESLAGTGLALARPEGQPLESITVLGGAERTVQVTWSPVKAGQLRFILSLRSNCLAEPVQVIIHGTATASAKAASQQLPAGSKRSPALVSPLKPPQQQQNVQLLSITPVQPQKAARPNGTTPIPSAALPDAHKRVSPHGIQLTDSDSTSSATAAMRALTQRAVSPLTMGKPSAVATRGRRPVHAASSIMSDRGEMQAQEHALTVWLNSILDPPSDPSGDSLADRRCTAHMRGLLWRLYRQDEGVRTVMYRLEQHIDGGFLCMREPASVMQDVHLRRVALETLSGYHPFWLRLGLELVLGKHVSIPASSTAHVQQASILRVVLADQFLGDDQLAASHSFNQTKRGLQTAAYWAELGKLVLKRVLLLVLLLDGAVMSQRAMSQQHTRTPLLFCKHAPVKSSAQVAAAVLRERLQGQGDVLRLLAAKGYKLSHEQDPRSELSMRVSAIAGDMRSGLRLCRLVEVLTGMQGLLARASMPADRRARQLYNLRLALQAATSAADRASVIAPEGLADGVCADTLRALWQLFCQLQLPQLVDARTLQSEIARVGQHSPAPAAPACSCLEASAQLPTLLLQWAATVAARFGIALTSVRGGFADGHLLCLLVAFYLPWVLTEGDCYTARGSHQQLPESGWLAEMEAKDTDDEAALKLHRAGVQRNHRKLLAAAARLGGIPPLLEASQSGEADEQTTLMFLGYLCKRLLEVSREERAAHVMQCLWRSRHMRMPGYARAHLRQWIAAASVVQRRVRAWLFRQRLRAGKGVRVRMLHAVTKLQALWRARQPRRSYVRLQWAAVTIQACWRGLQARKLCRDVFVIGPLLKQGLQEHARLARHRRLKNANVAATSIQTAWRAQRAWHAYRAQRAAAVVLQAHMRGLLVRKVYAHMRAAAVRVQACWRGTLARRHLERVRAACLLQKHCRRWLAVRMLRQSRQAARTLQAAWRMHAATRRYLQQKAAALKIQAAVRGHRVRVRVRSMHSAALTVQACWRGMRARTAVRRERAAVVVQRHVRGHMGRRTAQLRTQAVLCLQRHARGWLVKRTMSQQQAAAVIIQKHCRGFLARAHLRIAVRAAVCVQRFLRRWRLRRSFLQMRGAAIVLQAYWRGSRQRQANVRTHAAAVRVQTQWRAHAASSRYRQLRAAAVKLQAHWRARNARWLLTQHRTARAIQTYWRMWAVQHMLANWHAAATRIQASVRSWQQHRRYLALRAAAVKLQTAVRQRQARTKLLLTRQCVITCQRHWRGHQQRQRLAAWHAAAAVLQRCWRMHTAEQSFRKLRAASVCIQAAWRMHDARQRYNRMRSASIIVQAAWRGVAARKLAGRHRAARCIQRRYRGVQARRSLTRQHNAAIAVQRRWRGYMQRKMYRQALRLVVAMQAHARRTCAARAYNRQRQAAVFVQSHWRMRAAQRELARVKAAVRIQKHTRAWLTCRHMQAQQLAATRVQSVWRGFAQRRRWQKLRVAAVRLQACVRRALCRRRYSHMRAATLSLQKHWHARQARLYFKRSRAATVLQSQWRGRTARNALYLQSQAAVRLQAAWRCSTARASFLQLRMHVIQVQARARTAAAVRSWQRLRLAAIALQCAWRARQARVLTQRMRCVITIQRHVRGWLVRKLLRSWHAAAVVLQSYARMHGPRSRFVAMQRMQHATRNLARAAKWYTRRQAAAGSIQACWRGMLARRVFRSMQAAHQRKLAEEAARKADARSIIASWLPAMLAWTRLRRLRRAALVLQTRWRKRHMQRVRAAVAVQAHVRRWLAVQQLLRARKAASHIAARWRGACSRSTASIQARQYCARLAQLAEASRKQPGRWLSTRTRAALRLLAHARQVPQARQACRELAACTAVCIPCRQLLAAAPSGMTQLIHTAAACNRSKPHVSVLLDILSMLHAVARDRRSRHSVWEGTACVDMLSAQLLSFREHEEVFMAATDVLSAMSSNPSGALAVQANILAVRQLQGVCQLLTRKVDTEQRYLLRLEGEKGSDVTAKETTRRLMAAARQQRALAGALDACGCGLPAEAGASVQVSAEAEGQQAEAAWSYRNTRVREALHELSSLGRKA